MDNPFPSLWHLEGDIGSVAWYGARIWAWSTTRWWMLACLNKGATPMPSRTEVEETLDWLDDPQPMVEATMKCLKVLFSAEAVGNLR